MALLHVPTSGSQHPGFWTQTLGVWMWSCRCLCWSFWFLHSVLQTRGLFNQCLINGCMTILTQKQTSVNNLLRERLYQHGLIASELCLCSFWDWPNSCLVLLSVSANMLFRHTLHWTSSYLSMICLSKTVLWLKITNGFKCSWSTAEKLPLLLNIWKISVRVVLLRRDSSGK